MRAEQSRNSRPRVVTVSDSQFLGWNTDVTTVWNRVRARPPARFPRFEGSGTDARVVATPRIDDAGGPKASEISELRRTAKWRDPLEKTEEEDDLLTGEDLELFQNGEVQIPCHGQARPLVLSEKN